MNIRIDLFKALIIYVCILLTQVVFAQSDATNEVPLDDNAVESIVPDDQSTGFDQAIPEDTTATLIVPDVNTDSIVNKETEAQNLSDTLLKEVAPGDDQENASVPIENSPSLNEDTINSTPAVEQAPVSGEESAAQEEQVAPEPEEIKDIMIRFVKDKVSNAPDSMYMNICQVENTTSKPIKGVLQIRVPNSWSFVGSSKVRLNLNPGEVYYFPMRLSIPLNAVGGTAYIIDATFSTKTGVFSKATYVKVPTKSKWDMSLSSHTMYFNEYYETVKFELFFNNKGNAVELLGLDFNVGKMYDILEIDKEKIYLELQPYSDTSFTYTVKKRILSNDLYHTLKQNWREATITIKATSARDKKKSETLWLKDLENEYTHTKQEQSSPLNIETTVLNLLSASRPRVNTRAFGAVLLNGGHDLNYNFQYRDVFRVNPYRINYMGIPFNLNGHIKYKKDNKIFATIGDIQNYTMHNMTGIGAKGEYRIDDDQRVQASATFNRFFRDWVASGLYHRNINGIKARIGGAYEENTFRFFKASSVELGAGLAITKDHFVNVGLLGTMMQYNINQDINNPLDSNFLGFSYQLNYHGKYKQFRFNVNTRNDQFNYIRARPANTISGNIRYVLNDVSSIRYVSNFNSVRPIRTKYSIYYNGMYNMQWMNRLLYFRTLSKLISLETGPSYRLLNRKGFDKVLGVTSNFNNYFYGVYSAVRIKIAPEKIITPSITVGYSTFQELLLDTASYPGTVTANFRLSYTQRNMGVNAAYTYGPNFFIQQNFFEDEDDAVPSFETLGLRAHYEKYVKNRKYKFMGFLSYYLALPANRQAFVVTTRADMKFPKGWSGFVSGNAYTNSNERSGEGVVRQRFFAMHVGVVKSFDLPQPRIKYHDVKVVCFKDLNGDGKRDENEPYISNIRLVMNEDVQADPEKRILFGERELVSDPDGTILINDVPEGNYKMDYTPLVNLNSLYNANGDIQDLILSDNQTVYVPFVESYKVKGRVELERDAYTSLGAINVGGVRVTASNENGDTYSALTDGEGNYMINVPQAGTYLVKVNNIFGDAFEIDKEEFSVQFDGFKSYSLDFKFFEKERKVNYGKGENIYEFNSLNQKEPNTGFGSSGSEEELPPLEEE